METSKIFKCKYCNYMSNRNYNVKIHQFNKHYSEIQNDTTNNNTEQKVESKEQKVEFKKQEVESEEQEVELEEQKVELEEFFCKKCNKKYLTKKHLINHEIKCKGINNLTCPKCMFHFSSKSSKSHHIKRNNCKPKSIISAINNNSNNIINNITNNNNNTIINNNTINNYYINNYGSERLDYMTDDVVFNLIKNDDSINNCIIIKHFNKIFQKIII